MDYIFQVKDDILDGWEWLQEFLPNKVITYIEKSADDGQDLLKELYEETKKDVEEKTDKHVEEVSKIVEGFMDRLISIKDNTVEIGEYHKKSEFKMIVSRTLILQRKKFRT